MTDPTPADQGREPRDLPLLDRVEAELQKPGYSILLAWLAAHSGASARIALEEMTQLVRTLAAADAASLSSSCEVLTLSADEREWLAHAAALNGLTIREYVVRAVNDRLRKQGVDAVLLREEGEEDL